MQLRSLKTYCFRNLENGAVEFHPNLTLVVGRNGQGKTNLLEAVHFLSLAKSFRTAKASQLVRWDEDSCSVFGQVQYPEGSAELGMAIEKGRRRAYVDGDSVRTLQTFIGKLVTVLFTPQTLDLVQGAPAGRRDFLDSYLSLIEPRYYSSLTRYEEALKSKLRLLKEDECSASLVDPWNRILAEEGVRISQARKHFVQGLTKAAARTHSVFSPQGEQLNISLESHLIQGDSVVESGEFLEMLQARFPQEFSARRCLLGVHRDDCLLSLSERDARAYASQGQCRSIALSLVLGVIDLIISKTGDNPVVLLDDVTSELDEKRKQLFLELLLSLSSQVILSGTEVERELEGTVGSTEFLQISVDNGALSQGGFSS